MSIEIRPADSSDRIADKATLLGELQDEMTNRKSVIYNFINDNTIYSSAYDAAKTRVSNYTTLIAGVEYAIDKVTAADAAVNDAFASYEFAGLDKVSEAERKQMRDIAELTVETLNMKRMLLNTNDSKNSCHTSAYDASIKSAQENLAEATSKLEDIYLYCRETNSLYSSVADPMISAIGAGLRALANAKYVPGVGWPDMDMSWVDKLKTAAANGINDKSEIYNPETGEFDEVKCKELFGKPFELWQDSELVLMVEVYDSIWENNDDVAIEAFIRSGYTHSTTEGETSDHQWSSQAPLNVWELTDSFMIFSALYASSTYIAYPPGESPESIHRNLRGNTLLEICLRAGTVYSIQGVNPIEALSVSFGKEAGSNQIPLYVAVNYEGSMYGGVSFHAGSINIVDFLETHRDEILYSMRPDSFDNFLDKVGSHLLDESIMAAIGAFSEAAAETAKSVGSKANLALSFLESFYNDAYESSQFDFAKSDDDLINLARATGMVGYISSDDHLFSKGVSVRNLTYTEKLQQSVDAYNLKLLEIGEAGKPLGNKFINNAEDLTYPGEDGEMIVREPVSVEAIQNEIATNGFSGAMQNEWIRDFVDYSNRESYY